MSTKTYKAIKVKEIKKYETSDGKIFDSKEEAEKHETILLDPEKAKELKIKELEDRILGLESKNSFPWSKPNPDVLPWGPYQQPYNPTAPTPKLPSEPGNIVWNGKKNSSNK